ncbi:hmu [Symbiodinium sp. CCMP2592]|nr:hmu [Symbiodinium sp. CCMP2592]
MPVPQAPPADHVGGGVNCLDDTFSLVRAELLAQEREIQELQAEISELKANGPIVPRVVQDVADTYKVAVAPEEEDVVLKPKRASIVDAGDDHKIHVAFYEFDQSMWDAGLLLCFHHTGALDKFLLFIGVILNLALQMAMLLVVEFAMLDNPWTSEQVGEMLKWRVNSGHKQFFPDSGETLSQRLCSRKLWNFQQEVYNEVYDYLSKPVPGVVLSFLAVALWMLTIMMEYRSCVEQALGVWHLPSLKTEDEFEEVTEDGEIVVRGISPCLRFVAFVTLIVPRLFIMTSLAVVGSIYVAQTASLADIVLNCLALAFVLDVDELVAQVLLTEKLRGLLTKIQPIDCGKTKSVRAPFQDVFRLGLTFAGVGFCVVMILFPFKENVESAAAVLCGGNLEFSYTGGLEIDPHIVLRPVNFGTDQWTPATTDCPATDELFYLKKYYLPDLNSTANRSNTNSTTIVRSASEWDALKLKHVWNFLLHPETAKCPEGQILAPQVDGEDEEGPPARICQEFPPALRFALDEEKIENAGLGPIVATCPRFNPFAGCAASGTLPEACHWSWLSQRCDQEAPGLMHGQGCQAEWFVQCETWEWFNATHPTINCGIYDICGADETCGVMTGDVTLVFPNIDAARNNISAIITSTQRALANLTSTTTDQVTVTEATSRRLQNSTNSSNSSSIKLNYEITELPVTVFPERVVQQSTVLISRINIGLRAANLTVQSAAFQAPQTITRDRLQEIKCPNGGCYGDDGGYGGFDGDDGGFGGDDGDQGGDDGDQDGGDGNGDQDGGDGNGDDAGDQDGGGDSGHDSGNQDGGDDNGDDGGNQDGGDDSGNQDGGDNTGDDSGDQDGGDNSTDDSEDSGGDNTGDNNGDDGGNQDGGDNSGGNNGDDGGNQDGGDNTGDSNGDDGGNQNGGDNTGDSNGDDGGNQDGGDNSGGNNGDDGGNQDGGDNTGGNNGDEGGNQDGGDNTGDSNGDDGGNQNGGDNTGDSNGDDGGNQDGGDNTGGNNGDDGGNQNGGDNTGDNGGDSGGDNNSDSGGGSTGVNGGDSAGDNGGDNSTGDSGGDDTENSTDNSTGDNSDNTTTTTSTTTTTADNNDDDGGDSAGDDADDDADDGAE